MKIDHNSETVDGTSVVLEKNSNSLLETFTRHNND